MEVIRRGSLESEKKYKGTCDSCKSIIGAKHKELTHEHDRDGPLHGGTCPVCSKQIWFAPIK